jgi:SOS-response transcriptional repressor LexA
MVDKENNDVIEVLPVKAMAGYLAGYHDHEFIENLPVMKLPFKIVGKHRAFTIMGDSMPPLKEGTIIVGKYVESLNELNDGQTYIVLTKNDGVVYKRIYREKKKSENFLFVSDNKVYSPFPVSAKNILEAWSYVCSLNIGEHKPEDLNMESVIRFLQTQRVEISK